MINAGRIEPETTTADVCTTPASLDKLALQTGAGVRAGRITTDSRHMVHTSPWPSVKQKFHKNISTLKTWQFYTIRFPWRTKEKQSPHSLPMPRGASHDGAYDTGHKQAHNKRKMKAI